MCSSTRSTKAARLTRRPVVPNEQTTNPAPTSSANTGMINLNFEALTASISAAVQQAIQSGLTTSSTLVDRPQIDANTAAQVPETVVSQAIESEVSSMTSSAVQVINNTEGLGPDQGGKFHISHDASFRAIVLTAMHHLTFTVQYGLASGNIVGSRTV